MRVFQLSFSNKNNIKAQRLQVLCQLKCRCTWWLLGCLVVMHSHANEWEITGLSAQNMDDQVTVEMNSVKYTSEYELTTLRYTCPGQVQMYPIHQCADGRLSFNWQGQVYQVSVDTEYDASMGHWQLVVSGIVEGVTLTWSSSDPVIHMNFEQVPLTALLQQWPETMPALPELPAIVLNGGVYLDLKGQQLYTDKAMDFSGLSAEYSDDIIASELQGSIGFQFDVRQFKLEHQLQVTAGEALVNALYIDFSQFPITWSGTINQFNHTSYRFDAVLSNQQSLKLETEFELDKDFNFNRPMLKAHVLDAHYFNQQISASVLGIYGFGNTEMSGEFTLEAESIESLFDHWKVSFDDFYLLNEKRKLGVNSLSGRVHWAQNQRAPDSTINWDELTLAGLPINASEAMFNFTADHFEFIGKHQFPVFDGSVAMDVFSLDQLFSEEVGLQLKAEILPISLKLITEKLGWPVMSGQISGDIPGMVKQGSVVQFLGALNLKVFEGDMLIDQLSLERLFGVAPVIAADINFSGFDLSLLTETFGFGLISGKLSGEINDLRITNWKTDRMDAQVYTVKTKGVDQVISQRAIDNISSLGGIKGAISKTFLRFFDDFKYQKIKLSCKLHNSVCRIGGIKNQNQQFVIVEGGGIPKINIVGYIRSINWEEFISRLLNANYE